MLLDFVYVLLTDVVAVKPSTEPAEFAQAANTQTGVVIIGLNVLNELTERLAL